VLAMAHRGRLNVLVNLLGKKPREVFREFIDRTALDDGGGDVKYHLGYSSDFHSNAGPNVHLSLCFNPSHLEFVAPVALGRVRAKQDRSGDLRRKRGMALLMPLPEQTVEEILRANAARFGSYNNLSVLLLRKALSRSRALGYALNDIHNTTGATTLGLPIVNRYGDPFAAISIGAISSRMTEERQKELVSNLRKEVRVIETAMRETTQP